MRTKKILFYVLAGILGGCVPVMSLHPLYTEKDVVFEEKLLGTWVQDNNETTWQFTCPNEPEKTYEIVFSDKEGKKGLFSAHLIRLKDKLFLDLYPGEPPWDETDPNKIKWPYNTLFLLPAHTFVKVNSIEPALKLQITDDGRMKKLFEEDPGAVEHTSIEDKPVLTASTGELQAFVLKYADDGRLFTEEAVLVRQKTECPDEPNNTGPNATPKSQ